MGNSQPYNAWMDRIQEIVKLFPEKFRPGLTEQDVPLEATMHEVMMFLAQNLNWPAGKSPTLYPVV